MLPQSRFVDLICIIASPARIRSYRIRDYGYGTKGKEVGIGVDVGNIRSFVDSF